MKKLKFDHTFTDLQNLLPSFDEIPEQDVNCDQLMSDDAIREVAEYLKKNGLLSEEKTNRLRLATPMRLTGSVPPHNDSAFLTAGNMDKLAIIVVLFSHVERRPYTPDDLDYNYLYCHGYGFTPINQGDIIEFNAADEHALLVHGCVDMLTLWFNEA